MNLTRNECNEANIIRSSPRVVHTIMGEGRDEILPCIGAICGLAVLNLSSECIGAILGA